jgi:hypothetical protein
MGLGTVLLPIGLGIVLLVLVGRAVIRLYNKANDNVKSAVNEIGRTHP